MSTSLTTMDLLGLSASEAAQLLDDGKTSSVALIDAYLAHIDNHNHDGLHLNALISVAPRSQLMDVAAKLDAERAADQVRSPFHGVPIIVKDTFATKFDDTGLPSTAGGPCFRTAKPKRTAPIMQSLIDYGLILLGGQTQSPYIFGGLDPEDKRVIGHSSAAGSSSGSAAGVAAGFAPWSLGTEVCGSIITPAARAGLYALKCGPGTVDTKGVFAYTDVFDCIGGMAKSAKDLRWLSGVLMDNQEIHQTSSEDMNGLRVASTDCELWVLPDAICGFTEDTRKQTESGYKHVISKLKTLGASVTENIDLAVPWSTFQTAEGKSYIYHIAMYQFKNIHLRAWIDEFATSEVRSLEDIIKYNEKHADLCLPSQYPSQHEFTDLLENKTTAAECDEMVADMRKKAHDALDTIFANHDLIVAFADSAICIYASAAGYPVATVPLGLLKYDERNSRPYGLAVVAVKGEEKLLLRFMEAFEQAFPTRPLPPPLLKQYSESR